MQNTHMAPPQHQDWLYLDFHLPPTLPVSHDLGFPWLLPYGWEWPVVTTMGSSRTSPACSSACLEHHSSSSAIGEDASPECPRAAWPGAEGMQGTQLAVPEQEVVPFWAGVGNNGIQRRERVKPHHWLGGHLLQGEEKEGMKEKGRDEGERKE